MAVVSYVALLVGMGFLVARNLPALTVACLAIIAFICPRWLLLAGAIVTNRALVGYEVIGHLQAADILLLIFLLRWLSGMLASGVLRTPPRALTLWLGTFLLWAWISLVLASSWQTGWALGRITMYAAVFVAASMDAHSARPLLRFIAAYACLEALLALIGVTARVEGRLYGIVGDPVQTGLLMLAGLAAVRTLGMFPRRIAYVLLWATIVLTFTRSIWVASSVSLLVVAWPNLRTRLMRVAAVTLLALAASWWLIPVATTTFHLSSESIDLRVQSWTSGVHLVQSKPIVGNGWAIGTASDISTPPPFNLWINVAASTGIPGALLLTGFLVRLTASLAYSREALPRVWFQYVVGFLVLSLGEMTVWAAGSSTIEFFALTGAVVGALDTTLASPRREGASPGKGLQRAHASLPSPSA